MALALACAEIYTWLPYMLIFLAKPWLDRTILFVLSRAAFGLTTTWTDLWRERASVWRRQLLRTFTLCRLSPWRAYTQPVHQLEGLSGSAQSKRLATISQGKRWVASLVTSAFATLEVSLAIAMASLVFWMSPPEHRESVWALLFPSSQDGWSNAVNLVYAGVVLIIEPFYVAAGFAMYLNRRVELEAWDIEQELRRVFSLR